MQTIADKTARSGRTFGNARRQFRPDTRSMRVAVASADRHVLESSWLASLTSESKSTAASSSNGAGWLSDLTSESSSSASYSAPAATGEGAGWLSALTGDSPAKKSSAKSTSNYSPAPASSFSAPKSEGAGWLSALTGDSATKSYSAPAPTPSSAPTSDGAGWLSALTSGSTPPKAKAFNAPSPVQAAPASDGQGWLASLTGGSSASSTKSYSAPAPTPSYSAPTSDGAGWLSALTSGTTPPKAKAASVPSTPAFQPAASSNGAGWLAELTNGSSSKAASKPAATFKSSGSSDVMSRVVAVEAEIGNLRDDVLVQVDTIREEFRSTNSENMAFMLKQISGVDNSVKELRNETQDAVNGIKKELKVVNERLNHLEDDFYDDSPAATPSATWNAAAPETVNVNNGSSNGAGWLSSLM